VIHHEIDEKDCIISQNREIIDCLQLENLRYQDLIKQFEKEIDIFSHEV